MARVRTAGRRRQTGVLRLVVFAVVAAVGGTALWTSLQYSEAHAAARAGEGSRLPAQEEQPEPAEWSSSRKVEPGGSDGERSSGSGASDPSASLNAWAKLTDVASLSTTSGGRGGGGGGGAEHTEERQEQEQPAEQEQEQEQQEQQQHQQQQQGARFGYLTLDLRVPKAPPTYNSWVLSEDMLLFHERALQQQLEQVYVALALAAATGRAFILPQFSCFCHNSDSGEPLPRCRRLDATDAQFPETCPEEDILQPLDEFGSPGDASAGVPLTVLPHVELAKLDVPKEKTLVLRPSATLLWPTCVAPPDPHMQLPCTTDGHTEDGTPEVLVPPSLNDTHLLPFLESYQQQYSLWRLDLSDVGSHWHAFAGWDCAGPAHAFDLRMRSAARPWPLPTGGGLLHINMTTGRTYSAEPDLKDCPGGSALRRMQGAAQPSAAAGAMA
ncbi:hypothetical protein C2E20_0844 [Micractinium conductrix]|uniref:Uncharacterized protein n=1 Tax=Micractinium conductrix TaxID=554055 RepID=A0A2P6VRQ3_9CHLO|nr:hypothetical protein C2E20_0844 [Micractinium conductrix]|eukprot:PSC76778.1 hypothetical protein C2E20_0844 [Micractinium conductrix]